MSLPPDNSDNTGLRAAQWIHRLGVFKSSLMLLMILLAVSVVGSYLLDFFLAVENGDEDVVIAVLITFITAPWVILLFSSLVKQLVHSREFLQQTVSDLRSLRAQDAQVLTQLRTDIERLQADKDKWEQMQAEREQIMVGLEAKIQNQSEKEQQALRLSTLFRSIIDASPDLIYYRNQEGAFAGCNRVAEQLTGKSEQELIGLTPHEVYDEELAREVVASDNEVLESNASITEELWLRFADGRRRYYEMRKVPFFDLNGERIGLLAFGRDITERKQAEDAIAKASKDKTAFIATISHELRTPLNGIVGLSRMLRDTELTKEQFNWVSTVYASAIALGNIFNDIIDLDKLERDRLELSLKTVSLRDFASEVGSVIELLAADKSLKFKLDIVEPLPEFVEVDGTRLRQIMWNLLFNAVKFTPVGHVSLRVAALAPEDGVCLVHFDVADSGIGIPTAEIDKIFAMYYQVDSHKGATGTGIGLAICQQLVSMMNGSIQVDSKVGVGTTFSLELPLAVSKTRVQMETLLVQGLTILLVEDIHLNVMVARALLEKLGQFVDVAVTGEQALEKIRSQRYDLILLDIQLPDMSGFEVANRIQQEDLVADTRIVALTANVIKTRQEYLDQGIDDVIAKPIKKSRVIRVFNQLFAENQDIPEVPAIAEVAPTHQRARAVLDVELLTTLLDTIGIDMLRNSLDVLNDNMPTYIEMLKLSLSAKEKAEVCGHAHRIKGAASSVGLTGVQKIADQIQSGDHPAWWQNVHDWVEELEQAYRVDGSELQDWLHKQQLDD